LIAVLILLVKGTQFCLFASRGRAREATRSALLGGGGFFFLVFSDKVSN
jgi:hypothetical protein